MARSVREEAAVVGGQPLEGGGGDVGREGDEQVVAKRLPVRVGDLSGSTRRRRTGMALDVAPGELLADDVVEARPKAWM